ncbi:MAG: NAD-dependent epimerase/dehydratase family protein [Spirochaetota bacterium]
MKILVTGADGMLGSHVVRELLERGQKVRALLQPGRQTGTLDGLEIERVEGDLLQPEQVKAGLEGCRAVIHTAANTQIWPSRDRRIWAVNYKAVKILAAAVLQLGVRTFVHVGTATSFSPGPKEQPGTEEGPYTDGKYGLDYQDSKYAAQQLLLKMHREQGLPVKILNPAFMFGAYDSKPGAGQMILSVYAGKTPGYTSGGKSYVAARDVASAAANALQRGGYGQCYITAGENLDYGEAFRLIADTLGVKAPGLKILGVLVDAMGLVGSLWGRVSGRAPFLSYPMARVSHAECYYSNRKAVEELGMPQTDLPVAILECFNWLKENGYVEEK